MPFIDATLIGALHSPGPLRALQHDTQAHQKDLQVKPCHHIGYLLPSTHCLYLTVSIHTQSLARFLTVLPHLLATDCHSRSKQLVLMLKSPMLMGHLLTRFAIAAARLCRLAVSPGTPLCEHRTQSATVHKDEASSANGSFTIC